jgi:hypothetical protein
LDEECVVAFFGGATATGRAVFVTFVVLVKVFVLCFLAAITGALGFCFAERAGLAVPTLAAFLARAFPAGERLVAGFRRVDFPATIRLREDDVAFEWREEERDASFFTLLAMGLLMRKALDSQTIHHKDRRKKQGASLT